MNSSNPFDVIGANAVVTSTYGELHAGLTGKIIKAWMVTSGSLAGKKYVKLDLGKNLSGQPLRGSCPIEHIAIVDAEDKCITEDVIEQLKARIDALETKTSGLTMFR